MNIPYGYVYRIRNKINDKTYVGQRKLALDKSWRHYMGSGVLIKAAIEKYGPDSFVKELLAYADSYDELNELEIGLMIQERASGKAEYNLHIGSPVPRGGDACKNLSPEETKAVYEALALKTKERFRQRYENSISQHGAKILELYEESRSCLKVARQLGISAQYVNRFLKENNIALNHQNIEGRILNTEQKQKISEGVLNSIVKFLKECNICGFEFETKSFNSITCSECIPTRESERQRKGSPGKLPSVRKTSAHSPKTIFTCRNCGAEFEKHPDKEYKYCSKKCAGEGTRKSLPDVEVIRRLYWVEKMSANQIGEQYGVSGQTVRNYMRKNSVERRAERHHL